MTNKYLAAAAIAVLLAAAAVAWQWLAGEPLVDSVAEAPATGDVGATKAGTVATAGQKPAVATVEQPYRKMHDRDFVAVFHAARSSAEALDVIREGKLRGLPEANDALLELDGVCAAGAAGPADQAWVIAWFEAYCAGYTPIDRADGAMNHNILQEMSASRAATTALTRALDGIGKPEQGRVVLDALAAARTPYDVRAALQVAAAQDIDVLPIRDELATSRAGRRDTLNLTAELIFCRTTNGCGPGSMRAVGGCVMTGLCTQGYGLEDIYRQSVSPLMFTEADALARQLTSSRPAPR